MPQKTELFDERKYWAQVHCMLTSEQHNRTKCANNGHGKEKRMRKT
jgi:hypothetical protein